MATTRHPWKLAVLQINRDGTWTEIGRVEDPQAERAQRKAHALGWEAQGNQGALRFAIMNANALDTLLQRE